jgi:hypothetical protein
VLTWVTDVFPTEFIRKAVSIRIESEYDVIQSMVQAQMLTEDGLATRLDELVNLMRLYGELSREELMRAMSVQTYVGEIVATTSCTHATNRNVQHVFDTPGLMSACDNTERRSADLQSLLTSQDQPRVELMMAQTLPNLPKIPSDVVPPLPSLPTFRKLSVYDVTDATNVIAEYHKYCLK